MHPSITPVRIACWGTNGHQITEALRQRSDCRLVAVGAMSAPTWTPGLPIFERLEGLLANSDAELVSLCSPCRAEQEADARRCLAAGRHVLAEKPCALDEAGLDRLIATAQASGLLFHEMAETAFCRPWTGLRRLMDSRVLGRVVQITAQKSYPMHGGRPQDESLDGGIIRQAAIHALRWIEHACDQRITAVQAWQGRPAAPPPGRLVTAAALLVALEGGAVATVTANYANPQGLGAWGDDQLRVWGEHGLVEIVRATDHTRVVIGNEDRGPLPEVAPGVDWLAAICAEIRGVAPFPIALAQELAPTRWALRARAEARTLA